MVQEIRKNLKNISFVLIGIIALAIILKILSIFYPNQEVLKAINLVMKYRILDSAQYKLAIGQLIISIGSMIVGFKISAFISSVIIKNLLKSTSLNVGSQYAIQNLTYYTLILITIITALHISDIPVTIFAFLGGAIAIGLGFGTQNLLNNFISGIIIQTEKPMKVGDLIEIEGRRGIVSAIGARSTKIISTNNSHILLPNSYFLEKTFINWTLYDDTARSTINITLSSANSPKETMAILQEVFHKSSDILLDPAPKILLESINEIGLEYSLQFWYRLPSTGSKSQIESDVRVFLIETCMKNNLLLPIQKREIITRIIKDENSQSSNHNS